MSDIPRSNDIRKSSVTTGCTGEKGLGTAVGLVYNPALGTNPRRIPWVNGHHGYAHERGLVLYELAKLKEGPGMVLTPLALADFYPSTNTAQVFQGDSTESVVGFRHHLFGDAMVHITGEASLLASPCPEKSFARASALRLEFGSKFGVALAESVDRSARVGHAIGVGQDVHDAQVATQEACRLDSRGFGCFDGLVDEGAPATIDQSSFVLARKGHTRTGYEGKPLAVNKYRTVPLVPMLVKGDGSQGPKGCKGRTAGFVFVGSGHLANSYHRLRAGKTKARAGFVIGSALEGKPMEKLFREGNGRKPVAAVVELLHHRTEGMGVTLYLHYSRDVHALSIPLSASSG